MESHERAEKDYIMGMKYKEIAEKYGTTINTVKSWKKRYGWDRKKCAPKKEKVCTQNKVHVHDEPEVAADGTKDTIQNNELSPEQQMFCIYYSRTFNATQSYMKAYEGCAYSTALTNGPALLRKTQIKEEVARLKEIKRQQIVAREEDVVELQMRIAFADIGEIVSCNGYVIKAKEFTEIDTQLIKKVKNGQNGLSIEIEDRQKAISWLTKYFLMHPDDKNRDEFERKRVEEFERKQKEFELKQEGNKSSSEELLKNIQTITDILQHPVSNRNITDFEGGGNE